MEGVIRTRVGYAGGKTADPTYSRMGDHTETVQVDFDPDRISYERLLDIFWKEHDPGSRMVSRQYMNAVFYHDDAQKQAANRSKERLSAETGRVVRTSIVPVRTFTLAEDYHQKYTLGRNTDIMRRMRAIYPEMRDFVNSTAAARLNGYLGGKGTRVQLDKEIRLLGLTEAGEKHLRRSVRLR